MSELVSVLNTYSVTWLCVGCAFFIAALGVRVCIRASQR